MSDADILIQSEYSLKNLKNYKNSIDHTINDVVNIYAKLIIEYTKFSYETIKINKHLYFKYILLRGLNTITHIFNILLYNTKNINLTYYHCQKSYYYYIEFISQITNVQHSFLQLNSKDAIMYVYKQTLFELNHDLNKINDKDVEKFSQLTTYINLLNICVECTIKNDIRFYQNDFINQLEKTLNKITLLSYNNLNSFIILLEYISQKEIELDKIFDIIHLVIKKNKHQGTFIEKKIQDSNFDSYIIKSPDAFVNWLLDT